MVGWVSLCCCLSVGVSGRMGFALLLSVGGCFRLNGRRVIVVSW